MIKKYFILKRWVFWIALKDVNHKNKIERFTIWVRYVKRFTDAKNILTIFLMWVHYNNVYRVAIGYEHRNK